MIQKRKMWLIDVQYHNYWILWFLHILFQNILNCLNVLLLATLNFVV